MRREALDLGQALRQWVAEAEAEAEDAQKEAPKKTVKMGSFQGRFWGIPCHQAPTSSVAQSVAISEARFLARTDVSEIFWGALIVK